MADEATPTRSVRKHDDDDRGVRTEERSRTVGQQIGGFARELIIVVVGALVVSALLRAFVGQMFTIPSESMYNTLQDGDRVLAEKVTHFQRGQIVVFADPGGWLDTPIPYRSPARKVFEWIGVLPDTSQQYLIKRVIGMPGDTVQCCDDQGRITVNGQPLDETSYLYTDANGNQVEPSQIAFKVVVPAGRIFVLGDHRNDSEDSRCHLNQGDPPGMNGFVPQSDVVGTAVAIVSPFSRFAALRTPATFASVPAAAQSPPADPVVQPAGVTC